MTIASEDRKAGPFPGDGVTVNFDFTFKVFADTDVLVIQAVTATGAETQKTITTDYTVTLNPNQESSPGGRVTMLVAPPAGQTITLTSEVPNLQGKTITSLGGFFPQVLNDALDRLTVLVQQVRRDVARSVKVNISSTTTPDQLLADINTAVLSTAADAATATTQAGIATTQAGIATTQATAASNSANTAASVLENAALKGANSDITSLSGLTTALSVAQGGTGGSTANAARANLLQLPPVRQTVLSGPVDSNGYSAFGGSTGGTTVTASGTLVATTANGVSGDRIGSITNPSWTGLSTNGAMYLYLDIAADGTCTPGSTTLAPTYQFGGAYSTTNGQFTFNIQEMTGKVGNGSSATQTDRVFVGQVTVAGNVVTAITWYALMGRYSSGWFAVTANTVYSKNHNLGSSFWSFQVFATNDAGVTVMPIGGSYFDGSNNYGWLSQSGSTNVDPKTAVSIKTSVAAGAYTAAASHQWFVNRSW